MSGVHYMIPYLILMLMFETSVSRVGVNVSGLRNCSHPCSMTVYLSPRMNCIAACSLSSFAFISLSLYCFIFSISFII